MNGPLKTVGLAKFSSNFKGLAVSYFQRLCASRGLDFLTKLSHSLNFCKAKRVSKYPFVRFLFEKRRLNDSSSHLKHFEVSAVSQLQKSKCRKKRQSPPLEKSRFYHSPPLYPLPLRVGSHGRSLRLLWQIKYAAGSKGSTVNRHQRKGVGRQTFPPPERRQNKSDRGKSQESKSIDRKASCPPRSMKVWQNLKD